MRPAIPNLERLLETVLARSTGKESPIHGQRHWRQVAANGLDLLRAEGRGDGTVVFAFALLHDAMRENDAYDPQHGPRAARLARELDESVFAPSASQLAVLERACEQHADGLVTAEPTVAACWDADRLDLWRVGTRPSPRLLSTAAAREPERIAAAQHAGEPPSWNELHQALTAVTERSSP